MPLSKVIEQRLAAAGQDAARLEIQQQPDHDWKILAGQTVIARCSRLPDAVALVKEVAVERGRVSTKPDLQVVLLANTLEQITVWDGRWRM